MAYRLMMFVDQSNLWGSWREVNPGLRIDYQKLASVLTDRARSILGDVTYEGIYLYASYPPSDDKSPPEVKEGIIRRFKFFDAMRYIKGFTVRTFVRKKRWDECRSCKHRVTYTIEKGVDASIIADMLSLGWDDAFDAAILISDDADLIPAIEFLKRKGKHVIHATFTRFNRGRNTSKIAFGTIEMDFLTNEIRQG